MTNSRHAKRISKALSERICIIDGCDKGLDCRGLCVTHANAFYGRKRRMSKREFKRFEKRSLDDGLILARGEQLKLTQEGDAFSVVEK